MKIIKRVVASERWGRDQLRKGVRLLSTVKVKFSILTGICTIPVYVFI